MLKSIRLQNFFGFQDCTINLEKGANVLVGINGSGKSNFFKAVRLLTEGVGGTGISKVIEEEFGGIDKVWFKGRNEIHNSGINLTFNFDNTVFKNLTLAEINTVSYHIYLHDFAPYTGYVVGEESIYYKLNIRKNPQLVFARPDQNHYKVLDFYKKEDETNDMPLKKFKKDKELAFPEIVSYYIDLQDIKDSIEEMRLYTQIDVSKESKIRVSSMPYDIPFLSPDGSNLAQLLNTLKNKNRDSYNKINGALKDVNENFKDIGISINSSSRAELLIHETFNESIPASNISDGTLKFLCLMAILYNPNRGSVVCIDEPELGLHPDMINTLYEAIEFAAETSQIIISTHSAHLLDYFELEQIRVFEKDENNATIVKKYTEEEFSGWYEHFYPGQMWRAGNIGGNRW